MAQQAHRRTFFFLGAAQSPNGKGKNAEQKEQEGAIRDSPQGPRILELCTPAAFAASG